MGSRWLSGFCLDKDVKVEMLRFSIPSKKSISFPKKKKRIKDKDSYPILISQLPPRA